MATISIADNDARVQYTQAVTANTTQLTIDFPFFDYDDINVIVTSAAGVDTTLTRGTGTGTFAVTGTSVDDGYSGGYVTLGDTYSDSSTKYTIFRDIDVERTTDFPTSGPFNVSSLNTELDKIFAIEQELETKIGRTMKLADSDSAAELSLPNLDTRKGTVLAFNTTTGLPEAGPEIGDVSTIAAITADISTLADIEDGTDATDAIQTVAGISANVTTVAGISSNVTTVAGNTSNINAVAADATDIGTVATNISNVNTVAGISSDVTTVAGVTTDLSNVTSNLTAIQNAATNATNAAASATAAATSETNAATSETNAATSATSSATSATSSAASATAAAASESAAATSETNAATSASNASTSETNAASSASSASTSATNAATSASNASTSESNAATSATNAATSASAAAASQTAAAASAASAASAYDSFDDRYLGTKASDPTLDNDGNALVSGALYFNSTANEMRVYDGANWIAATSAGGVSLILYEYTATSGQTTFSGSDDNAATLSYTADNIQVFMNGVNLDPSDYTATNGTSVVLATGATTGDLVNIYAFKSFTVADTVSASAGGTFNANVAVNGTVTADGLTVDGIATIRGDGTYLIIEDTAGAAQDDGRIQVSASTMLFKDHGTNTTRAAIDLSGGDISFYDSTGTTQGLFWDASTQRLGLGTTSPGGSLEVYKAGTSEVLIGTDNGGTAQLSLYESDDGTKEGLLKYDGTNNRIHLATSAAANALVIPRDSGHVGMGVVPTGSWNLQVASSSGSSRIRMQNSTTGTADGDGGSVSMEGNTFVLQNSEAGSIKFEMAGSERMRIDSSGNLLVGKTDTSTATEGAVLGPGGLQSFTRDGDTVLRVRRNSGDGTLIQFYQDGNNVGEIKADGGDLLIGTGDTGIRFVDGEDVLAPFNVSTGLGRDNVIDIGKSSERFDNIFATNGTIQTSDQNEKQQIASLTTAEMTAAKAISKLFKTFKWNDKVEAKGDAARRHAGVIAQEVQTAMTDAGLNAADYAFWCSDTWTNEDGTSQTRLGIRYPELLAFIGAATEQRLADIEARIEALENAS